jgi:hypothetical protein
VAPTLRLLQPDTENPLHAEVIFIKASAAVGKSTLANRLSNVLGIPLLDLATIPVSTGSLKALLMDISGAGNPIKSFHSGKLPVIIDALDEGRLLSGEQGLESFLETTGEFLNEDRSCPKRPKLILFGRYDSIEVAELWLDLTGHNVTTCKMEVAFFAEDAAWKLIHAYADSVAKEKSAYRIHREPVRLLIKAYFDAIESALDLPVGELWSANQGKAFAGYAPVLAAMGSLIAQLDNFKDVTNRLKETGTKEAWQVINTVLKEITDREKRKLCEKAEAKMSGKLPPEAYDTEEQLTLLSQFVHGQQLEGSGRVKLAGSDQTIYQTMVKGYILEHPFVRNREFGNAVLGSVVVAHAIAHDLLRSADLEQVANLSRQPFLWRAIVQEISTNPAISGRYLGYLLNSLWNEPVQSNYRVEISAGDELRASVTIYQNRRRSLTFIATLPIAFFAQIKACEVDVVGKIQLLGDGPASSMAFFTRGSSVIICSELDVDAASVRFEGDAWFEAERVSTPSQFRLFVVNGAKLGWGGNLATRHPWNEITPTLAPPYDVVPDDTLTAIATALAQRTMPGGTLILNLDFTPVPEDPHLRWAARQFSRQLPLLIKMLVKHKLASHEPLGTSDHGTKLKIRFEFAWWDLVSALEKPDAFPKWQSFIAEARREIRG